MCEVELYLSHVLCPRLQMQNESFIIKNKFSSYSCNYFFFFWILSVIDGFISENVHVFYKVNYYLLYFCWQNKFGGSEQISNMQFLLQALFFHYIFKIKKSLLIQLCKIEFLTESSWRFLLSIYAVNPVCAEKSELCLQH